jgi:hypothetical protein
MQAMAWCSVWLRVIRAEVTPRFVGKFLAGPENTRNGSPLGLSRMPMSRPTHRLPIVLDGTHIFFEL